MVIIPHETELLKLVKFQKLLISNTNDSNSVYIASQPLWIPFQCNSNINTKDDLKQISKTINSIELNNIEKSANDFYISVTIATTNGTFTSKLPLLRLYHGNEKSIPANTDLPFKKIKIFRLGIPEDLSENSKAIIESVWCKL